MKCPLAILTALLLNLSLSAAAPAWEDVNAPAVPVTEHLDAENISIAVKDGYLYVTASATVEIRIFSILGQLISKNTLQPGTWRLKLPAKGIYVLKAGTTTRRITI